MDNLAVVNLSEEDAAKFMLFMKYYDMFSLLVERGVFEQRKATIALNFDHNGVLKSIQRADFLYSSEHPQQPLNT